LALTALFYHHGIVPCEVVPDATPPFERFLLALARIIWWITARGCSRASRLRNLVYFHEVDRGGHFATWERTRLFNAELRAALRSLR
jgi:pimeloyl-ACP methyl ester carboxylesterase